MGIKNISAVGVVVLLLMACATNRSQMVSPEEFASSKTSTVRARQLRPGDEIMFSVEVNGREEVAPTRLILNFSGSITAPLIGDMKMESLTLLQARDLLEESYNRIFVNKPMVTLRMANEKQAGEWGYVTVLGNVRNPGRFPVRTSAGMNLSDALHEAGGFGDSANMEGIVVTRRLESGSQIQCSCDITKLGKAGSGQVDMQLFDGDIIFVPERLF